MHLGCEEMTNNQMHSYSIFSSWIFVQRISVFIVVSLGVRRPHLRRFPFAKWIHENWRKEARANEKERTAWENYQTHQKLPADDKIWMAVEIAEKSTKWKSLNHHTKYSYQHLFSPHVFHLIMKIVIGHDKWRTCALTQLEFELTYMENGSENTRVKWN